MVRKNAKDDSKPATNADFDAFKAEILNLLSNISKTGTAPAEYGAVEDAQAMEYARKNNLVVYEIVGYSFRSSDGKTPDMKSLKAEMQNIYGCKALQEASGVNTGSSIVMSVFPVEVKKVE
jgi:hypothetical protein